MDKEKLSSPALAEDSPKQQPNASPRPPLSKAKLCAFGAVAVAMSLLLACLLVEVAARAFLAARPNDIEALRRFEHTKRSQPNQPLTLIHFVRPSKNPTLVYELIPGAEGIFRGAPVKINSAGFRDRERSLAKPPQTFRIAAVGDSIVFGWGTPQETRFSDLLERFLNETAAPGSKRFEVLNFGVPGYNTVMEAEQLQKVGLRYSPDAVILSFVYDNDSQVPNFLTKPRPLFTLTHSYALEMLLSRSLAKTRMALEAGVQGVDPKNVPAEFQFLMGWDNARRALRQIHDTCSRQGLPVIFRPDYWTAEPWRGNAAKPLEEGTGSEILRDAKAIGYQIADPRPEMLRFVDSQHYHSYALCVAPDQNDGHPNAIGHAINAKVLYKSLVDSGALPDASERRKRLEQDLKRWDEIIAKAQASVQIAGKYKNFTPGAALPE